MNISKSMIQSYNLYKALDPINIKILSAIFDSYKKGTKFDYTELLNISPHLGTSVSTIKARVTRMISFGLVSRSERSYRESTIKLTDLGREVVEGTNILDGKKIKLNNFSQFVFLKACSSLKQFTKKEILKKTDFTERVINYHIKSFQKKKGLTFIGSRMKMDSYSLTALSTENCQLMFQFEDIFEEGSIQSYPKLSIPYMQLLKYDFILVYHILHEIEESKAGAAASTLTNLVRTFLVRKQKLNDLLRICQFLNLIQTRSAERGEKFIYLTEMGLNFYRPFEILTTKKIV